MGGVARKVISKPKIVQQVQPAPIARRLPRRGARQRSVIHRVHLDSRLITK